MSALTNLRTEPELLSELETGAATARTASELLEQRISFIYGSMSSDSNVTREQIRRVLAREAVTNVDSVRTHRD